MVAVVALVPFVLRARRIEQQVAIDGASSNLVAVIQIGIKLKLTESPGAKFISSLPEGLSSRPR